MFHFTIWVFGHHCPTAWPCHQHFEPSDLETGKEPSVWKSFHVLFFLRKLLCSTTSQLIHFVLPAWSLRSTVCRSSDTIPNLSVYLSCCYLIIPNTSAITLIEHFICKTLGVEICKLLVFLAKSMKFISYKAFSLSAVNASPRLGLYQSFTILCCRAIF